MEILGNHEIPIGFSMALAKDSNAMNAFSTLSEEKRQQLIESSRQIQTKKDMESFVNQISQNKTF